MTGTRRTILITGAGAGIGRATAELFASRGWFVGLYDIDTAAVAELRGALGEHNATDGRLDVSDPASWSAALDSFWQASGERLDVLFNNAGIILAGPFAQNALAAQQKVLDVNVAGVMNGAHASYPYLKRTPGARLINMASASAIYGQPDIAIYSASKFAVRGFTEALSLEWRKDGIGVAAIWPLWVKTALAGAAASAKTTSTLGVRLRPEDVAEVVWRAATDRGRRTRVHWKVGMPTAVFATAARLVPPASTRWLIGRLAGA